MNTTTLLLTIAGLVAVPVGYNESQQWSGIHESSKHNEQDAVTAAETNANVKAIKESVERQEQLLKDINNHIRDKR